jgi:4-hydroxythreonine-4-phosphate dehydrogenase
MKRRLVVTPGDPDGIGPEIVWKSIRKHHSKWKKHVILCVGARKPFDRLGALVIPADPENLVAPREARPHVWLLEAPAFADPALHLQGYQSGWSIETATLLVQSGEFDALVTGPIHKDRLNLGGFTFSGHTDFLAALSADEGGTPPSVTMMLANPKLRVALVTTHISLADVSAKLTGEKIRIACENVRSALTSWWGVKKPRIAVCSLNPHNGENGRFGREEIDVIEPALESLRSEWKSKAALLGPLPSDTFFAQHVSMKPKERADAVVCMYHDQGLIPVKMIDFPHTVNITLGLPFIRTSVDHGTAFDIAWKNKADPRSFESAITLALELTKKRRIS